VASKRNKTKWPGIYYEIKKDGSKSFIATWKEPILDPANPFGEQRRTVERRAATSDEARIVKHTGELNAREMRETQFASSLHGSPSVNGQRLSSQRGDAAVIPALSAIPPSSITMCSPRLET